MGIRVVWHAVVALGAAVATFVATGFAVVAGPSLWAQWTDRVQTATLAGQAYRVYRPVVLPPRPGLVVDLHPSGANGFWEEATTRLHGQAERQGWIIAYPDGADNVASLAGLIDHLEATENVDPDRVYVIGLSRGGITAYRAACELSLRIAAIAVVAGNMADQHGDVRGAGCRPQRPVSLLAIHGTADSAIPIAGGGRFAPFTDVIGYWRELDGCGADGAVTSTGSSTDTTWQCRTGTQVRSIVVTGAGHTFPGAPLESLPWSPGASLDASTVIAEFLAGHRRASASR